MKKSFIAVSLAVIVILSSGTALALTRIPDTKPVSATSQNTAGGNKLIKLEDEDAVNQNAAGNNENLQAENKGNYMPALNRNPEPFYKDNHNLPKEKLYDISKDLKNEEKLKEENAEIKSVELMTYKEYLDSVGDKHGIDASLSPERQVWIVKIYYPNGIKIDRVNPGLANKHGDKDYVIKNALRTILYDAETGESISVHDVAMQ